jgi:ABC-2 type transport system permease protein
MTNLAAVSFDQDEISSWQKGFTILLGKELRSWWSTRRWMVQGLLWSLGLNGMLFVALFILPEMMRIQGEESGDPLVVGGQMFFALGMMAVSVGAIILTQGDILDERETGTAEWILSKPVPRSAFVLSKLVSNALSILVLMIFIPSLLAYGQFAIAASDDIRLPVFLIGLGMMVLHVLFYLSLTLMLGVLLKNRGALLGISLGCLLGGMLLRSLWPLSLVMPWILPDLAGRALTGEPLDLVFPLAMTAVWSFLLVGMALMRFGELEF